MITVDSHANGRITIASAMGLIAMAALVLSSSISRNSPISGLVHLTIWLALPLHYLITLRRMLSALEIAVASLAMTDMAFVASGFIPPIDHQFAWDLFCVVGLVYRRASYGLGYWDPWPHILNRGGFERSASLLCAFYAAILALAIIRRIEARSVESRPAHFSSSPGRNHAWLRCIPPASELVLTLWLASGWARLLLDYGLLRPVWSLPIGLSGAVVLAVADWRPRPPNWSLTRLAARILQLLPGSSAGLVCGLIWSSNGLRSAVIAAACFFLAITFLRRRSSFLQRRGALVHLLAALWGTALSCEFAGSPIAKIN